MFGRILAPVDGSALAESVLPHVVAVARAFGSRVTLLRVLEAEGHAHGLAPFDQLAWQINRTEAEAYLHTLTERLIALDVRADYVLLEGQAAQRIIEYSTTNDVDLIMLSSHGRGGLSASNISSVGQKVIQQARVSTLIVRAYHGWSGELGDLRYEWIVVPLDGSQRAECALSPVTTLAQFHRSQVTLAHVVLRPEIPRRTPPTREDLELSEQIIERNRERALAYMDQLRSRLPSGVVTQVVISDDVVDTLNRLGKSDRPGLLVLSAHGYFADPKRPFGSVATNFIHYGTTSLLVVQDMSREEVEPTEVEIAVREHKGH